MLSIERCRELIPEADKYTDENIEKVRDDIYALVEIILDEWLENRMEPSGTVTLEEGPSQVE